MKLTFNKTDKMLVWNRLFSNLHYSDKVNFYLLAGYHDYNIDMSRWEEVYPGLSNDHFFIKLDKYFQHNDVLISDAFNEFQICALLVNENNNLDKEYDFSYLRLYLKDVDNMFNGYIINELTDEYIIIDWNINYLSKKNIVDDELKKYLLSF